MTAKFLFFLLCALSAFFLLRGLWRKDGVFQLPVLFSAAFAFSTIPQLVNCVFYRERIPERVLNDHGVEYGLVMCILCLVAGIAGYGGISGSRAAGLRRLIPVVTGEKLFWPGVVLCLVGLYGASNVDALAGGFKARFTEGGHYALEWRGAPVLWAYVSKMLPLGLAFCLFSSLLRGTLLKWGFTLAMMVYPLANIVFLGRRTSTFGLITLVALSLFFRKQWAPPRIVAIAAMAAGGLLIILMPYYRTDVNKTGDVKGAIEQVDPELAVDLYLRGERQEGMDMLIVGIPARLDQGSFGLGSGFWNEAVDYLVPRQLVGQGLKRGLMMNIAETDEDVFSRYAGETPAYGAFSTGPYSAFREFWFLGCLLFYGMARFYRRLWRLAAEERLLGAQLLYVATALMIPMAVVNSITATFPMFLLAAGVVGAALWVVGHTANPMSRPARARRGSAAVEKHSPLNRALTARRM